MLQDLLARTMRAGFRKVNRVIAWHRLPTWISVANLAALRQDLRETSLHSVPEPMGCPYARKLEGSYPSCLTARTSDGSYNDLGSPRMGSSGARFGRNVPISEARADPMPALMTPSPRLVSNRLLARGEFKPATTLNLLAAAWIQFMTHDWFSHGAPDPARAFEIPLDADDPWEGGKMAVGRTTADPHPTPDGPATFRNEVTHWWDASQIYGSDAATASALREHVGGRLQLQQGQLPIDPTTGMEKVGFNGAWWIGLSFLHTLFVREHNAVCHMLSQHYPDWDDQRLYDTARQVVAALLAKIHTVEWTPGILGSPALRIAMNANWWGLATEEIKRIWGRITDVDEVSGIIGGHADHQGEPFAMTEEFTAVYRLHPLLPDELEVRSALDGGLIKRSTMTDFLFGRAHELVHSGAASMTDLAYSLGRAHPGSIELHNYPRFLRQLDTLEGTRVDLGAVDILRDRERGVPRYNRFLKLVGKRPARSFADITSNAAWAADLREVYGDVEQVDLLAGMLAEDRPKGFGFSDTAFRVFILMASRRLKSDRFFTDDYGPHVYTPEGLRWIDDNNLSSVLLRHHPALGSALRHVGNAFAPWNQAVEVPRADAKPRTRSLANGNTHGELAVAPAQLAEVATSEE